MTTTTLNDTLVQLEGLYTAYQTLLTDAQGQLESLSMGAEEIKKVTESLESNPNFQRDTAEKMLTVATSMINNADEELMETWRASRFLTVLTEKCLRTIKSELEPLIKQQVKDVVQSGLIERLIADKITASERIETSLTVANNLEAALKPILDKHQASTV